jgi:hypothetical protein
MLSSLGYINRRMGTGYGLGIALPSSASLVGGLETAGISAGVDAATSAILGWIHSISASHTADTNTTTIVNNLANLLQANLNAFLNGPRTCADQQAALAAYDTAWTWLQGPQACGNPSPAIQAGGAGARCISDRAPGGKTPWQTYYRDPIAAVTPSDMDQGSCSTLENSVGQSSAISALASVTGSTQLASEAAVTLPASTVASTTSTTTSSVTSALTSSPLLLLGGLGLVAYFLFKD